ncbi:MAG: YihY/virulence factor BrkB family protein [Polyangiaceae bacterium]|nr:YihY/virulence factor BrkB family protein [Polyangiaceae bacterium]
MPENRESRLEQASPPWFDKTIGHWLPSTHFGRQAYFVLVAMIRHHGIRTANAVAFDLFLAMVPMLGVTGWLLAHLLTSSPGATHATGLLLNLTPNQVHGFLNLHISELAAKNIAPVAVLVGWWLSSSAFYTLICVFEETFDCIPRSWVSGRLLSLGFALLGMFTLGSAVAASLIASADLIALPAFGFSKIEENQLLRWLGVPLGLVAIAAFLSFIYRYSIYRPGYRRTVWPGATVATILGVCASIVLGYYASNIASYAVFYGGLAVIVITMLWLWLWATAVLIGAEVNIALEELRFQKNHPDFQIDLPAILAAKKRLLSAPQARKKIMPSPKRD